MKSGQYQALEANPQLDIGYLVSVSQVGEQSLSDKTVTTAFIELSANR
jgi:hypothetical protein